MHHLAISLSSQPVGPSLAAVHTWTDYFYGKRPYSKRTVHRAHEPHLYICPTPDVPALIHSPQHIFLKAPFQEMAIDHIFWFQKYPNASTSVHRDAVEVHHALTLLETLLAWRGVLSLQNRSLFSSLCLMIASKHL